jgi:hypothetical protein
VGLSPCLVQCTYKPEAEQGTSNVSCVVCEGLLLIQRWRYIWLSVAIRSQWRMKVSCVASGTSFRRSECGSCSGGVRLAVAILLVGELQCRGLWNTVPKAKVLSGRTALKSYICTNLHQLGPSTAKRL